VPAGAAMRRVRPNRVREAKFISEVNLRPHESGLCSLRILFCRGSAVEKLQG
jgi:hypothetical protein